MGTHPAEWAFYGAFRGSGLQNGLCKARTEVQFDAATGLASWYIRVVDAAKRAAGDGECWPDDPDAGVLNPNVTVPEGEGYITYRVRVREDAPGNARIDSSASIVFDYNPPIVTDPAWWNTVYEIATVPVTIDGETTELSLVVGEPYGELPTPKAKPGYTFDGWWTGANGTGRRVTPETIVQSGDHLYANWVKDADPEPVWTVTFDANGGTLDGARNFFTSKDKAEQSMANALVDKWIGAVNAVWSDGSISVVVAKKGKTKSTVLLSDGTKGTANGVLLVGEEWCCIPIVVTKKVSLSVIFWLPYDGGDVLVTGLDGAIVGRPGNLASGTKFYVDRDDALWSQISGMVLNGKGYGTATIKKVGSMDITIE